MSGSQRSARQSGPLLTLGLGIALIDLLTDGSLLARLPLLLYAWAVSQAVGVDAQLVATWDRARLALREGRYWALLGLIVLGGVLAYVAWVAAQVFALQESKGVTTEVALARLGMDSAGWLVQRTALSVLLVCLAGWTRYHPPAKDVAAEAKAERQRLEAALLLEPLRQQVRAQRMWGMRGVISAAIGNVKNVLIAAPGTVETRSALSRAEVDTPTHGEDGEEHDQARRHPAAAGEERVVVTSGVRAGGQGVQTRETGVLRLPRRHQHREDVVDGRRRGANPSYPSRVRTATVEVQARAAWQPGMSVGQLQHAAGISRSAVGKYRRTFLAEAVGNRQMAQ